MATINKREFDDRCWTKGGTRITNIAFERERQVAAYKLAIQEYGDPFLAVGPDNRSLHWLGTKGDVSPEDQLMQDMLAETLNKFAKVFGTESFETVNDAYCPNLSKFWKLVEKHGREPA